MMIGYWLGVEFLFRQYYPVRRKKRLVLYKYTLMAHNWQKLKVDVDILENCSCHKIYRAEGLVYLFTNIVKSCNFYEYVKFRAHFVKNW